MVNWAFRCRPTVGVIVAVVAAVSCGTGCGDSSAAEDTEGVTVNAAEAKRVLLKLPYRYEFRQVKLPDGASSAIAGRVYGLHKTWFDFGIAFGNQSMPVSVPRAGVSGAIGNPGFVFNSNIVVPGRQSRWEAGRQFHTAAQWHESGHMENEMEQSLCKAVTGEPCPV